MSARALVLSEPRRLVEHSLALPEIGDDDGILRVEACGLCGTDHEQWTGDLPGPMPFVPGHESVGVIEAVGPRAAERWGVQVGQRVAVEVFLSCGECERCKRGEYRRCHKHGLGHMYGSVRVTESPGLWGGYATHQYLAPDSMLLPVPEGVDAITATLFNPLGAGLRWAATVGGIEKDHVVAILGPGIRGLSALIAARQAGAGFVMVTGAGARDEPRLQMAKRFGADVVVDVTQADPSGVLRETAGRLADVVVDVTAKAPSALGQAVLVARAGGTIVLAGTRGSNETPGLVPDLIVYKELKIQGALGVDTPAYRAALDLIASGAYPFDELPRKVVGLDGADDLLRTMAGEGDGPPPMHAVLTP